MKSQLYQWSDEAVLDEDGVIVGCTESHEWLLPWWWMNFRMHNEYPVTFIDFGDMSAAAKEWCLKRGRLKTLEIPIEYFVTSLDEAHPEQAKIWQWREGYDIEKARLSWFKKPFACLQSPFKRTIWMDVDCQVRKPIQPIFSYCENPLGFAIAEEHPSEQQKHKETGLIQQDEVEYNSGVFVYKNGAPILSDWAKMGIEHNHSLRGDQEALSRMAFHNNIKLPTLPPEYNCRYHLNDGSDNTIIHWLGVGQEIVKDLILFLDYKCSMNFSIN